MAKFGEGDERWIVRDRQDGTNVNAWHWTNKDMTRSGIDELKRALSALELVDDLPASRAVRVCARLSDVSVEGSVEALNRKGRQFLIYELELSAKWRATLASAGAPAADGAAEGEDDEALARRLQAEEDARAGELSGSVQLGEWTHDEEDCPPIELKLSTARPFGAEVDEAGVRACATRLVERGLARALAEWARATRERVRAGGGGTPPVARPPPGTADGTAAKPAGVPVRASSPASPAASNAAAGGGSSGAAASASRASPLAAAAGADSGQRLRSALGTFCARGDGERGALSLKGLGLGDAEVPTLIECLHSRACAPTTSVDLSANALTDGGVAQVLDALHAPGCAPALRALQLGGTRASPASAQRATALRERRAQLVVAFDGVDPAAKGTRCLCVVGTAHAGSPAEAAGLREGDSVVRFGSADGWNFTSIEASIVPLVKAAAAAGETVPVEVTRVESAGDVRVERRTVQLAPRAWSGSGLVGCVLHPHF